MKNQVVTMILIVIILSSFIGIVSAEDDLAYVCQDINRKGLWNATCFLYDNIINLENALITETISRPEADNLLQSTIDAEKVARVGADAALQNAIDAETASRIEADILLQNAITTEESARILAGYLTYESDPTVDASVKDGVSWYEISEMPADFIDGVDENTQLSEAEVDAMVANNGYLTSFTETDPTLTLLKLMELVNYDFHNLGGIDKDTQLTDIDITAMGYIKEYTETDPTVIASVKDGIDWSEVSNIPADIADGDQVGLISVSWSGISDIPTGFADGLDDDTTLTEADVDAFVNNNGYLSEADVTNLRNDVSGMATDIAAIQGCITAMQNDIIDIQGSLTDSLPRGVIVMWSGLLSDIPQGWALCDGTDGTPNLTNSFVYGVSPGENPGNTGGTVSHSHTVDPHSHTVDPPLTTSGPNFYNSVNKFASDNSEGNRYYHSHNVDIPSFESDISSPGTSSESNLPPYYKVAFIMKL